MFNLIIFLIYLIGILAYENVFKVEQYNGIIIPAILFIFI